MFWQMTLSADSVLPVEPLEERHPLGKIGLSPGVVEPALARLVADERWPNAAGWASISSTSRRVRVRLSAAMHNCSCTADAEDVVQDVFEKLLCYNGRFESEEHLKAWLLRVTINRCHDLTRAARQKDTELDENLPAPGQMEDGSVLDAVRALPENYRNAVYLHYYEGYTAAEVGRMLGAPTNTVLSWLRRARAQLHTMLKEEIEDEVV
mgnify:CR=1 FL=1